MGWKGSLRRQVNRLLSRYGHRIVNSETVAFEAILYLRLEKHGQVTFVQIGANDGTSWDPLHDFILQNRHKVRGLVVEPLPDLYERLAHNYRNCLNVTPVNCAIHRSETKMTLYRVDPMRLNELPDWAKGVASFDKNHHKRSGIPSHYIVPETVRCLTLRDLLDQFHMCNLDLLQIDTEGYDAEILRGIDFNAIRPKIIRFEHDLAHGTMSRDELQEMIGILHANAYEILIEGCDATAFRQDLVLDF